MQSGFFRFIAADLYDIYFNSEKLLLYLIYNLLKLPGR